MSWIEIIAERKIRDAQEEGAFDNLPGKGRRLDLDSDTRVPPEQRAAYRLMKESRVLPDWIQLDREIRAGLDRWEADVARFTDSWESIRHRPEPDPDELLDRFLERSARALVELNRLIDRFEVVAPRAAPRRVRIPIRERMEALAARYPRRRALPSRARPRWEDALPPARPALRLANRMPRRARRDSLG